MYKIVNNKIRVNIPEYIARPTHVTGSYHSSKLINIGSNSNTYKYNFFLTKTLFTFLFIRSSFRGRI